jgi:hypothetical protein
VDTPWVRVGVALSKLKTAVMGGAGVGEGVGDDVGTAVGEGVDVGCWLLVGAEVDRGVADGTGVIELLEVGLGLGVEVCVGELVGIVGVGEVEVVEVEGQLLEANQTTPTITIMITTETTRSFGQVKNFPTIFKSSANMNNDSLQA